MGALGLGWTFLLIFCADSQSSLSGREGAALARAASSEGFALGAFGPRALSVAPRRRSKMAAPGLRRRSPEPRRLLGEAVGPPVAGVPGRAPSSPACDPASLCPAPAEPAESGLQRRTEPRPTPVQKLEPAYLAGEAPHRILLEKAPSRSLSPSNSIVLSDTWTRVSSHFQGR
uniref:Uncharacterized protein n=1 Tax=Mustela putorius furo TaxID=9669 RepID=M3YB50_MUSPF